MQGLQIHKNKSNGFAVVFLHYSAHPEKSSDLFKENVKQGFISEQDFKREYELDFTTLEGSKVITNFSIDQVSQIPFDKDRIVYCGTDWGYKHPAHIMTQFNAHDQWLWLRCFTGSDMMTQTFLEVIKYLRGELHFDVLREDSQEYINTKHLESWIPYPSQLKCVDFCDSAGTAMSDKNPETNIEIARQPPFNMKMMYRKTNPELGVNLMALRMRKRKDGLFGVMIDSSCQDIIKALSGGFVRDVKGKISDNYYTNVMDSVRYVIVNKSNERIEQNIYTGRKENWSKFIKSKPKLLTENQIVQQIKDRYAKQRESSELIA